MPTSSRKPMKEALISVVLPLYNEATVLRRLNQSLIDVLEQVSGNFELIFVNDGSRDGSDHLLDQMAALDPRIRVLHFSRNFGHQAAVQAGLEHARGDAIIIMDTDLQDDPRAILKFLEAWQGGYDVVYAVRVDRKEGPIKRALFYAFYRVLNKVAASPIPKDAGNFGLVDARVAQQIAGLNDYDRFYPGLRSWVGYHQIGIPVERNARHDDKPRVSLTQLFRLAKSAIFSFSSVPLSMFYAIAAVSLCVCGGLCGFTLYHKLFTGLAIPGWASVTIAASFFGALNALGIGILGEYVIRIYDQVRARPGYIVARQTNFDEKRTSRSDQLLAELAEYWGSPESRDESPVRKQESRETAPTHGT